ncbi:hypothetical protein HDU82_004046, partial [Entophlyctis luteolus]
GALNYCGGCECVCNLRKPKLRRLLRVVAYVLAAKLDVCVGAQRRAFVDVRAPSEVTLAQDPSIGRHGEAAH